MYHVVFIERFINRWLAINIRNKMRKKCEGSFKVTLNWTCEDIHLIISNKLSCKMSNLQKYVPLKGLLELVVLVMLVVHLEKESIKD